MVCGNVRESDSSACTNCGNTPNSSQWPTPELTPIPSIPPPQESPNNIKPVYVVVALVFGALVLGIGPFDNDNGNSSSSSLTADGAMKNMFSDFSAGDLNGYCSNFMYENGNFLDTTDYDDCVYMMGTYYDNITLVVRNVSVERTLYKAAYTGYIYVVSANLEMCYYDPDYGADCDDDWVEIEWAKNSANGKWGTPFDSDEFDYV